MFIRHISIAACLFKVFIYIFESLQKLHEIDFVLITHIFVSFWKENVKTCRGHFPCHNLIGLVILFSNRSPQLNSWFETAWRAIKISVKHWRSQSHYPSAVSNTHRWSNWIFIRFNLIHISLFVQADFCNPWLCIFEFACWCHFRIELRLSIDLFFNCVRSNLVLPFGKICRS